MKPGKPQLNLKMRAFLAAFRAFPLIGEAAKAARVHRVTHHRWTRENEAYREAFDALRAEVLSYLEDEAWQRAVHGVPVHIAINGRLVMDPTNPDQVYTEYRYSDQILIFLLRAWMPEKYRRRIRVEATPREPLKLPQSDPAAIAALIGVMKDAEE